MAAPTPPKTYSATITSAQSARIKSDLPNNTLYPISALYLQYSPEESLVQKWNLSGVSIPNDAIFLSAKLKFTTWGNSPPRAIEISQLTSPTTINIPAVTYNDRDSTIPLPWSTAGGDIDHIVQTITPGIGYVETTIQITDELRPLFQTLSAASRKWAIKYRRANSGSSNIQIFTELDPTRFPSITITWIEPGQRADLGRFTLGAAGLGQCIPKLMESDTISLSEQFKLAMDIHINETISWGEFYDLANTIILEFSDTISFEERWSIISEYLAGILGRIKTYLDIGSKDFCEIVIEGGMTIELNSVLERAYVFIKQSGQKFDHGIDIKAGDAVMFSCPDLEVNVGDEVIFDNQQFIVADNINHYYDGNIVYRKSALQRVRFATPIPKVLGLTAGDNTTGKVLLTWFAIPNEYQLSNYEIWFSEDGATWDFLDTSKDNSYTAKNLEPYKLYYFIVRGIDVYGYQGEFSDAAYCGFDDTGPADVSGLR